MRNTVPSMTIEELEKVLNRIHEWIRAADQKISIFLAFEGIIISILSIPTINWIGKNYSNFNNTNLILLIVSLFLFIYGFIKTVIALGPVLKNKNSRHFTYFGNIANFELKEYKSLLNKVSREDYKDELQEQIFISSKIANRKHIYFGDSLILFYLAIIFLILSYLVFIFSYGI